jgi:tRNA (guanine-N7-)-methyltransferase
MVRPKDISPPFEKSNPRVMIHDQVWYIPPFASFSDFTFPGWAGVFQREGPVRIEYCTGNGAWIAEKAQAFPEYNWLAVEIQFDRARKVWSKIQNHSIKNLVVAFADAMVLSSHYIPSGSVECIYVNFPDPWPKRRHERHRIISSYFFEDTARILQPNGRLVFVTDDEPYSDIFLNISGSQSLLVPTLPHPYFSTPPDDYGTSFFDSLFRKQGKTIRYHELIRK